MPLGKFHYFKAETCETIYLFKKDTYVINKKLALQLLLKIKTEVYLKYVN